MHFCGASPNFLLKSLFNLVRQKWVGEYVLSVAFLLTKIYKYLIITYLFLDIDALFGNGGSLCGGSSCRGVG